MLNGVSAEKLEDEKREEWQNLSIREHIISCMEDGMSKKESIKKVSKDRKLTKNEVYQEALDL